MSHRPDDSFQEGYHGDPAGPYKAQQGVEEAFSRPSFASDTSHTLSVDGSSGLPDLHHSLHDPGDNLFHPRDNPFHPRDNPFHPRDNPFHPRDNPFHPRDNPLHPRDNPLHPRDDLVHPSSQEPADRPASVREDQLNVLSEVEQTRAVPNGDTPLSVGSGRSDRRTAAEFHQLRRHPSPLPEFSPGKVPDEGSAQSRRASPPRWTSRSQELDSGTFSVPDDTAHLLPPPPLSSSSLSDYQTFPEGEPAAAMDCSSKSDNGWKQESSSASPAQKRSDNTVFVWVLASFATIGGLLFGYDTGIVSGSMLLIQPYFDLSTVWEEGIVSGTIGAAAVFALIAGFACDWVGRKKTIMFASFIFAVGAIVMAVADSKEVLLVGRIIVGIGIGFASMSVPIYVAESAPPSIRGRLVTLNQLFITIGILLSSIIAGAFSDMKDTGWRYMLGIAAVPGVIQFLGFLYLPESPRWLVAKGREEEARKVLQRIRGHEDVEEELAEVKEAEESKQRGFVLGQILKTPHVRKALFVGCGLQLFQQMCGINTVIYYSATILKQAGTSPSQAIWLVCVPFGVNFLATFIGVWAVERLGRKLLLVLSFIGVIIALIVLAVGFLLSIKHSPAVNGTMPVFYDNGTLVLDQCQQYTVCEDCSSNDKCGYCYDDNAPDGAAATCLQAYDDDKDLYSDYGRCSRDYQASPTESIQWTYGYCPTDYTWMAVLGLALFVLSFAPGLGPMPWTINSEIFPMWARGTGVSISTMVNWAFNLVVSFSFLTMLENITKYGTFFLFTGICVLGTLFAVIFVPETRNKSLEEVQELFMIPAVREKSQRERQAAKEAVQMDNRGYTPTSPTASSSSLSNRL